MSYRERRLAKAERLRKWAEKRQTKANAQLNSQPELRHDWAFITQPGHIPERARMNARDDRACESFSKASEMESRAASIEAAADKAIYSDDEDAPDCLRARIAELEAKRERMKATNAAYRKGDVAYAAFLGVTLEKAAALRVEIESGLSWHRQPYPTYSLTNLGSNIRRQKLRLAQIEKEKVEGPPWRYFHASKYASTCVACEKPIEKGTPIVYRRGTDEAQHYACFQAVDLGRAESVDAAAPNETEEGVRDA